MQFFFWNAYKVCYYGLNYIWFSVVLSLVSKHIHVLPQASQTSNNTCMVSVLKKALYKQD